MRHHSLLLGIPILISALALIGAESYHQPEAQDADSDGMTDAYVAYAQFFGLNPTNLVADAYLDFDSDYLNNWQEFVLLTDPFAPDTDRDGFEDDVDANPISRAYIQWGAPQFTTGDQYDYAHPDWFLRAYKVGGEWVVDLATTQSAWRVSGPENKDIYSLNIDLDRSILTNNLRYAIHYAAGTRSVKGDISSGGTGFIPTMFVDLLDTNGLAVVEDLYGNLLAGSNAESTVIFDIPTAKFPDAAVIQLRSGLSSVVSGKEEASAKTAVEVFVYEGLLYVDEDGDGLDADQERQIGTSDYSVDSNGNGTNDYDECFHGGGSSTNNPLPPSPPPPPPPSPQPNERKIIYVDQAIGNDAFTGGDAAVAGGNKGPKKTVEKGMGAVDKDQVPAMVIKSGKYGENLDIRGKNVKVFIEGNVRL